MKIREIFIKLKKKTFVRNPEILTRRENIRIGVCQILDGLIAVFTNGRRIGSFSSDAIHASIIAGIERRKEMEK